MAAAAILGEIGEIPVLVTAFAFDFAVGAVQREDQLVVAEAEAGGGIFSVVAVDANGAVGGGVQVDELGLFSLVTLAAGVRTQLNPAVGLVAAGAFYRSPLVVETVAGQAEGGDIVVEERQGTEQQIRLCPQVIPVASPTLFYQVDLAVNPGANFPLLFDLLVAPFTQLGADAVKWFVALAAIFLKGEVGVEAAQGGAAVGQRGKITRAEGAAPFEVDAGSQGEHEDECRNHRHRGEDGVLPFS